jgi:hypothetical protein
MMDSGSEKSTADLDQRIAVLEESVLKLRTELTHLKRQRASRVASEASARVRRERAERAADRVQDLHWRAGGGRSAMKIVIESTGLNERTAYRLLNRDSVAQGQQILDHNPGDDEDQGIGDIHRA